MSEDGVWAVYRGDYETTMLCVGATKKDAEAIKDKYNADPGNWQTAYVTWLPLVAPDVQKIKTYQLTVTLWDDGLVSDDNEHVREEWPFDMAYPSAYAVEWRWVRAPVHKNKGGRLDVHAKDIDKGREVLKEMRTYFSQPENAKSRERKGHVK